MTETNLVAEVGLTPRAAKVVTQLAAEVARREGHDYVGTEHLLVALSEERKGPRVRCYISRGWLRPSWTQR